MRGVPVRVDQLRLDARHRLDHRRQQPRAVDAGHACAGDAVEHHQVHVVARPGRKRREQERRLHRGIQPDAVADAGGRRATGVDDDDDVPIALRPPRAEHRRAGTRGRPPVDRAHVVAAHVLPQRVELGALPPHLDAGVAVELAQACQPRRQMTPRGERRQHADLAPRRDRALASGESERPVRAHHHHLARERAAPTGEKRHHEVTPLTGRDLQRQTLGRGARRRLPRIAQPSADAAGAGVGDPQPHRRLRTEQGLRRCVAGDAQHPRRGGGGHIHHCEKRAQHDPQRRRDPRVDAAQSRRRHHRNDADGDQQRQAPGDEHGQTGTRVCWTTEASTESTETPSSSASGRRRMRCRQVGTSIVCTWSGVMAG